MADITVDRYDTVHAYRAASQTIAEAIIDEGGSSWRAHNRRADLLKRYVALVLWLSKHDGENTGTYSVLPDRA